MTLFTGEKNLQVSRCSATSEKINPHIRVKRKNAYFLCPYIDRIILFLKKVNITIPQEETKINISSALVILATITMFSSLKFVRHSILRPF